MEKLIKEKEERAHRLWIWKERLFPVCMWSWGIAVVVGIGSCALQVDGNLIYVPFISVFVFLFTFIAYLERKEHQLNDEARKLRYFLETSGSEEPDEDDEQFLSETVTLRRELEDQRSRAWEFTRLVAILSGFFVGFSSYWFVADFLDLPRIGAVVGWVSAFVAIAVVGKLLGKYFQVPQ